MEKILPKTNRISDNIQIKNIQKVENPNYVFITINTNEINVPNLKSIKN
jgi:hypothetical protein